MLCSVQSEYVQIIVILYICVTHGRIRAHLRFKWNSRNFVECEHTILHSMNVAINKFCMFLSGNKEIFSIFLSTWHYRFGTNTLPTTKWRVTSATPVTLVVAKFQMLCTVHEHDIKLYTHMPEWSYCRRSCKRTKKGGV